MVVVTQTRVEISTWGSGVYKMAQKVPMPLMDGLPHLQDPRGRVNVNIVPLVVLRSQFISIGGHID